MDRLGKIFGSIGNHFAAAIGRSPPSKGLSRRHGTQEPAQDGEAIDSTHVRYMGQVNNLA